MPRALRSREREKARLPFSTPLARIIRRFEGSVNPWCFFKLLVEHFMFEYFLEPFGNHLHVNVVRKCLLLFAAPRIPWHVTILRLFWQHGSAWPHAHVATVSSRVATGSMRSLSVKPWIWVPGRIGGWLAAASSVHVGISFDERQLLPSFANTLFGSESLGASSARPRNS